MPTEPAPDRHHRQSLLAQIGPAGQERLSRAGAMVVGMGALGCTAAELLLRAGVGHLTLVDRDVVELTNLPRQGLYDERDAQEAAPKALAAQRRLRAIDGRARVDAVLADVTWRNARTITDEAGMLEGRSSLAPRVIVDATDNFHTRFLLNDLAVACGVPLVYAGVVGTGGRVMNVLPAGALGAGTPAGPCLRCVFDEPPAPGSVAASQTCDTVGVLGAAVGAIGALQAAEALKILLGDAGAVSRRLVSLDAWTGAHQSLDLSRARRDDCPCCAQRRFEFLDGARDAGDAALCGQHAVQVGVGRAGPVPCPPLDLADVERRLLTHGTFVRTAHVLRGQLVHERSELGLPIALTVFIDGRAIVSGTREPARARAIYDRYIGR